jgi:fructose-1,6-bisphosphatase/inositol monophosphatase family enzyme
MPFTLADTLRVARILAEAARAEIAPRFRNLDPGEVRAKSSASDLVTEADEAAERAIGAALREAFPGCLVVGEEAAERDPGLLDRIGGADLAFIVDPVDGTRNFAAGLPVFQVMTGVCVRGEVAAGVIHDPLGGDWAMALRGEGAWLERPDGRRTDLRAAPPAPLPEMEGVAYWHHLDEPERSRAAAGFPRFSAVGAFRCSAYEYRLLAGGHLHFSLYGKLMPWDHAAGWLIHREAGGHAARLDASPYLPTHTRGGILCAPDRASWGEIREALLGPLPGA